MTVAAETARSNRRWIPPSILPVLAHRDLVVEELPRPVWT
jgi:hypothetical protein